MSVLYVRDNNGNLVPVQTIQGPPGPAPVKGFDYFTAEEKAEIVNSVTASLPSETWTLTLEDGSTVTKVVLLG